MELLRALESPLMSMCHSHARTHTHTLPLTSNGSPSEPAKLVHARRASCCYMQVRFRWLKPYIPYPCRSAASRYKMGTLSGGSAILALFDGQPQHWQAFKAKVCRLCDEKDWTWLIEGANVLSDHHQVIVAAMTATSKRSAGGMSTDFSKCHAERLEPRASQAKPGPSPCMPLSPR